VIVGPAGSSVGQTAVINAVSVPPFFGVAALLTDEPTVTQIMLATTTPIAPSLYKRLN